MPSTPLRVADVLRSYGEAFLADHPIDSHHRRVIRHLLDCRTAALGGHLYECEHCGQQVPLYNSCRDRHCPTCQTTRKQQWLEDRQQELLPVPYFHVVFTLPHDLQAMTVGIPAPAAGSGMGNLGSVSNACAFLGLNARILTRAEDMEEGSSKETSDRSSW